ncbi:hypothetical protein [Actinomadura sp. WAC 06369]|uniref:hypothetical protein n=1 Tax=Actinomadura sp. WAC 06369 TaxID=2203193 RepID=UPI000F79E89F|nr:hypothetical protein [Actinomadura sp. WAC 06369]
MTDEDLTGVPPPRRATRRNKRTHRSPRRDHAVFIALSEEEHACITAAAEREYLATAAWAAQTLLAAANGSARPEYAEFREILGAVIQASGQARRIGVNLNQVVAALHSGESLPQIRWYAEAAARTVDKLDELAEELRRRLP